jgi:hypothetical protein
MRVMGAKASEDDVAVVRDRKGRAWTITVMPVDQNDDLSPWLELSPEERVNLIGECVLDGMLLEGKRDIPRLRRVYRVLERPSRAVPDRRRVRSGVSRTAKQGH